ncbi:unnamed protein product [Cyprideis torosa]|uniref:Uncharacterized protein n=1 Tax=Cyprideis torosa TaxID=163714 RepID=A0A7R8WG93_9CRUS|nr:unnamed protein product [Cyprideis torosa]CAG0895078.1 unnamed protein product [Cyprideis torosa]
MHFHIRLTRLNCYRPNSQGRKPALRFPFSSERIRPRPVSARKFHRIESRRALSLVREISLVPNERKSWEMSFLLTQSKI